MVCTHSFHSPHCTPFSRSKYLSLRDVFSPVSPDSWAFVFPCWHPASRLCTMYRDISRRVCGKLFCQGQGPSTLDPHGRLSPHGDRWGDSNILQGKHKLHTVPDRIHCWGCSTILFISGNPFPEIEKIGKTRVIGAKIIDL